MTYVVLVGTDANTARPDHREFAGQHAHGGFDTLEEAQAFADGVNQEWMKQLKEQGHAAFPYGAPFTRVLPVDMSAVLVGWHESRAAKAARNWYRES